MGGKDALNHRFRGPGGLPGPGAGGYAGHEQSTDRGSGLVPGGCGRSGGAGLPAFLKHAEPSPRGPLSPERRRPDSSERADGRSGRGAEPSGSAPVRAPRVMAGVASCAAGRRRRSRRGTLKAVAVGAAALIGVTAVLAPSAGADRGPAMPSAPSALGGFVKVHKGGLFVDGQPWSAVGFNDYRLAAIPGGYVCDGSAGAVSDDELGALLDRAAAAGATTIRTWFFQSSWDPDGDGSGDWSAFDRILDAAAARGLRVVPVLANQWGDCENGEPEKDLSFYAGGYRKPQHPYAVSYLDYATQVAAHYADSPAVAYWQLINEPEAPSAGTCDEAAAADAIAGFAAAGATAIRAVDPHHPISLGTTGSGQCGTAGADYLRASSAVDVCEIHVYDGPDTGTSPATPMPGDATNGAAARIDACNAAGKPIVAGELGFAADLDAGGQPTGSVTTQTLAQRASFLQARVAAMDAAGLDGYMVWQLDSREPLADGADTYAVGPCDPVDAVIASSGGAAANELAAAPSCGPGAAQGSAA